MVGQVVTQLILCQCLRHGHWLSADGIASAEFADKREGRAVLESEIQVGRVAPYEQQILEACLRASGLPETSDEWTTSMAARANRAAIEEIPLGDGCAFEAAAGIAG